MNTRKELNYKLYVQKENSFIRTSFQQEFGRYKDVQNGDIEKVKENIRAVRKDYYKGKGTLSKNPLRNIQYHVIIATAIVARVCVEGGMNHNEAYTLSDIYIQRVDEATNQEQIIDLLEEMQLDFAAHMKELRKENAISLHTRRCIDYIYEHLHEKVTINELANYIGRNPSYLSKLFAQEIGIPIHEFILNARIETAKNILTNTDFSYIDIAMSLGFSSQSAFISTFKKKTGITPKEYRNENYAKTLSLN